jgi:hypothetical protein
VKVPVAVSVPQLGLALILHADSSFVFFGGSTARRSGMVDVGNGKVKAMKSGLLRTIHTCCTKKNEGENQTYKTFKTDPKEIAVFASACFLNVKRHCSN